MCMQDRNDAINDNCKIRMEISYDLIEEYNQESYTQSCKCCGCVIFGIEILSEN